VGEEGARAAVQGAAAEDCGGDGALGLGVGDADETAGLGFVHGHFGDEGDAHAGTDHGEKTGEMAAFEDNARVEAGAVAGGDGGIAEAVAVAEKEEWIAAEIGELQRGAAGELVCFRQGGVEAFGEERVGVEFVAADGEGEDGKIDGAGAKAIEENRSDFFGDGEMNFWKFAGEGCEALRKPVRSDSGNCADDYGSGFGLQAFGELVLGAGKFVEDGAGAREKGFTEVGEANGAAEAVEEAAAEFGFELLDLLGKRGLGDVAFFGGAGEGAGVGDGGEVAELMEFHGGGVYSYEFLVLGKSLHDAEPYLLMNG
jgi:hypothetical protein